MNSIKFTFIRIGILSLSIVGCISLMGQKAVTKVVEDGGTGPHKALMIAEPSLQTHTVFRPEDLSKFGKDHKLPIIAWGNGACANSPWEHVNFLSEVASYGYLVIAIGPMPVEGVKPEGRTQSKQLTDAIDWAIAENSNKTSPLFGKVATDKVSVSGMSCGGLQTIEMAPDPRVTTAVVYNSGVLGNGGGMPGMPPLKKEDLLKIHSPVLYMLGGPSDIAYNNGMDDYKRIEHVPAFAANLEVGHGGTYRQPHGGEFAIVATAWYNWQLKGDKNASKMFVGENCGLCKSDKWTFESKNLK
ncbi:MAG TPA: hypothetical protein PLY70_12320 [Saprospiraceae bacterium]|nr:hypothetical protein [Saprospiraceae bacterium]HPN71686.1 hypothetical protein [Saprospiraceae bacterium]